MRGLVFSGIGSYSIFEASIASKLNQSYQIFAGTGFGSFNAVYLSQYRESSFRQGSQDLLRLMSNLDPSKVNPIKALRLFRRDPHDVSKFWKWSCLNLDRTKLNLSETTCHIHLMDREYLQRKYVTNRSREIIHWVQQASCTPLIHNVSPASQLGSCLTIGLESLVSICTQIDVVLPFNPRSPRGGTVGSNPVQFILDTQRSLWLRELMAYRDYEPVDIMVHFPKEPLGVNPLDFKEKSVKRLVELGLDMYSVKVGYLL